MLKALVLAFAEMCDMCHIKSEVRIFGSLYGKNTYSNYYIDKLDKTIHTRIVKKYGSIKKFENKLKEEFNDKTKNYMDINPKFDIIIKSFEDDYGTLLKNKDFIGAYDCFTNTDHYAILNAGRALYRRNENKKLLITLSDLAPICCHNADRLDYITKANIMRKEIVKSVYYLATCKIKSYNIILDEFNNEREMWLRDNKDYCEQMGFDYHLIPYDFEMEKLISIFSEIIDSL